MIAELEAALALPPYSLAQPEKDKLMLAGLSRLTEHHRAACLPYQRILEGSWRQALPARRPEDIPYLPVSLFKTQKLQSVPDAAVRMVMTSSGTTGQAVSRISVDTETSHIQQKALANSLSHILGRKRLPMLVIDTDTVFKDPALISARGAGVLGLMRYGHKHTFALDRNLAPDFAAVEQFLAEHGKEPFFMFGFTYMVWINFYERFRDAGLDLSQGILIHSGGWKKMIERQVDNRVFRQALGDAFGLTRIHNFFGMVEQIGSIFLEGPEGLLYPPNYSDVIIRDPETWEPCEPGRPGVIQVVSLLPHSYPGHSLLTEDRGIICEVDSGIGGWMGKSIQVLGRIPRAELRGCSDVLASAA